MYYLVLSFFAGALYIYLQGLYIFKLIEKMREKESIRTGVFEYPLSGIATYY